ncbi:MAG: bacillithiol biosynthesis cysteine-adding enzyme BshC [Bacteroidia bacterium]
MTSTPNPYTDFDCIQLERDDTYFSSDFIESYTKSQSLKEFYSYDPSLEGLRDRISDKPEFKPEQRTLLVDCLAQQYQRSGIDLSNSPVGEALKKLAKEKTYTVTTGQQIHVGVGPLYVLYKILDTIRLAEEISQTEEIDVVPVFWMATEDHDLEEIQDVSLFGKRFKWKTDQEGAVGRMSTEGIHDLFVEIEGTLNLSERQLDFLKLAKECYSSSNYADANRRLVHALFENSGLLVLDADEKSLKSLITEIFSNELKGLNLASLKNATEKFAEKGYGSQVHVRDINLFLLNKNGRHRIIRENEELLANDRILCKTHEIDQFLEDNYQNISPNVLIRPLYQEMILPNLMYVAGPSELKYWMQLKLLFEQYKLQLPLLFLRTSNVVLREKQLNKMDINHLSTLYKPEKDIISHISEKMAVIEQNLMAELEKSRKALQELSNLSALTLKGFSLEGKINKIEPKLTEIEGLISERLSQMAKDDSKLKAILKFKNAHFDPSNPQERVKHLIEFPELLSYDWTAKKLFGLGNLLKVNHLVTKSV